MQRILYYFLLLFLPLVYFPFGISIYEPIKVILGEVVILGILLWTVLRWRNERIEKGFLFILCAILVLSLTHLILGRGMFFGNPFRMQGIFLVWNMILLAWLSSKFSLDLSKSIYPFLILFLFFIASLKQTATGFTRVVGTLGEPNAFAASILFLWPWAFFYFKENRVRWFVGFLAMGIILLTHSRSGILGFIFQVLVLGSYFIVKISLKWTVIISFCLILLSFVLPFLDSHRIWENRSQIWKTSLEAGSQFPVLGGGFGAIENRIHQTSRPYENEIYYQYIDSSHNILLDWWVQGGLIGMILFLLLIGFSSYNLIQRKAYLYLVVLVGLLTALSFNPASVVSLISLWWIIGQGFSEYT